MAYRGKFHPKNIEKYVGDASDIVYRSSWELKLFGYFDSHPNVLRWTSETIVIPYKSPVDKKVHRYFVDAWAQFQMKDGEIVEFLIEVKPASQKIPPPQSMRAAHPRRYKRALITYAINQAKWEAAQKVSNAKGWKFVIMDEYDLGIKLRRKDDNG